MLSLRDKVNTKFNEIQVDNKNRRISLFYFKTRKVEQPGFEPRLIIKDDDWMTTKPNHVST